MSKDTSNIQPADKKAAARAKKVSVRQVDLVLTGKRADKRGIKNMLNRLVDAREEIVRNEEIN